jgi:hypothetical protein
LLSSLININGYKRSFQQITKRKIPVAPIAGRDKGSATERNILQWPAPSILAASNISRDKSLKNELNINIEIGRVSAIFTSTKPINELFKCNFTKRT